MARGKVQLRRIENRVHRQVTFCKRRAGLLKKARELSVLCDAEIGVVIFSDHGKLYELATKGNMQDLIQRYNSTFAESHVEDIGDMNQCEQKIPMGDTSNEQEMEQEISTMKQEIGLLQKGLRCMFGVEPGNMTLNELQALERHLEIWMCHIQSTKMQIMFQEIQLLKNEEGILRAANEILQRKIVEQDEIFDVNAAVREFPYPLIIQNGIYN